MSKTTLPLYQSLEDEMGNGHLGKLSMYFSFDLDGNPCVDVQLDDRDEYSIFGDLNFHSLNEALQALDRGVHEWVMKQRQANKEKSE